MITLVTGQPGAGKTLYSLYIIEQMARLENRTVYYSGIKDLALPWNELKEVADWINCPTGSIIVIDECQRAFRPRGNGSNVPESVSAMETHRHNGFDLFLITQHPMLLDSNIRRLVGRHLHVVRAFGAKAANVHEWGEVHENCDKNRTGSIKKFWKYQKEIFLFYKSAEQHTHKFRPPVRLFALIGLPIIIGLIVWWFYSWYQSKLIPKELPGSKFSSSVPGQPAKAKEAPSYLLSMVPRVPGFPHTAPIYEEATKPIDAPYPVGCLQYKECSCYDQQGHVIPTPPDVCRSLLHNGFFKSWEKNERIKK